MRHDEFLHLVALRLESLGLKYYITGGSATIFYGEFRFTHDVDLVAEIPSWKVRELCELFPQTDYYVEELAALEAVRLGTMFNIIHVSSGFKADIVGYKDNLQDSLALGRRRKLAIGDGREAYFASPEDVILGKLIFFREGASDKHLRDIASMLKISGDIIDRAYIDQWALRLGVADEWRMVRSRVEGPNAGA